MKISRTPCMKVPDKFAPRKKKYSSVSSMSFMHKPLSSAQMKKRRIKNCSELNRLFYVRERNYSVYLLEKSIKKIIMQTRVDNML